ncbi:hypothetical protein [Allonocardiopsis opalescens]|uniref:Uncharacterized protein n=1 Tax=Allonocardiopsis opalescens TaxID=1144618 RepID=A0A2T0PXN7_9ACTN|nr:hypothetical protein [Allonocardiopsis opalescens]PRX96305.1 hypothetical protein CLV72_108312 [Allonocardiopsis opalescens]
MQPEQADALTRVYQQDARKRAERERAVREAERRGRAGADGDVRPAARRR